MKLTRIASISNYRIFRNFVWPTGLPEFSKVNLIYGWNGSGKTSLSSLFAHLQSKTIPNEGDFDLRFDDRTSITNQNITTVDGLMVRVFNRDFIEETILPIIHDSKIPPVFYLGQDSATGKRQIEELKNELQIVEGKKRQSIQSVQAAQKKIDDFFINKAKLVKEALLGSQAYANYNRNYFEKKFVELKSQQVKPPLLENDEKEKLNKQRMLKPKEDIKNIVLSIPDVSSFRTTMRDLLERSISSQVIDFLAKNDEASSWVQEGLKLHPKTEEEMPCIFCGNILSSERRAQLDAHFNDVYKQFQDEITQAITQIKQALNELNSISIALPDKAHFYEHLTSEVESSLSEVHAAINKVRPILLEFQHNLESKKASAFMPQTPKNDADASAVEDGRPTSRTLLKKAISSLNSFIHKHNTTTSNMQSEVSIACIALETNLAVEAMSEYDELFTLLDEKSSDAFVLENKPTIIRSEITEIERRITDYRLPADELNAELTAFLGRNELQFEFQETGYSLKRGGHVAYDLSEGERTAIAFLYFLKKLKDKDFDENLGIVVIDDPVSSLDSNSLFSAFGYMKECQKDCQQLFILTHNFTFFSQAKNWIYHMKNQRSPKIDKRPGRFYSLLASLNDGERSANLAPIDPLLTEYESEYHYLFKTLQDATNPGDNTEEGLTQYYSIPNIARRLLEMFLAYHLPNKKNLHGKLDSIENFDRAKKTRILRFLETFSHADRIAGPEHDLSILTETRDIVKNLFELIEYCDNHHYCVMCEECT